MRADRRPLADLRARVDDRRRVDLGAIRDEAEQQLGFGDDLVADVGGGLRLRERGPLPAERDLEPQAIAGDDLAPELGAVDAAQVDARVRRRVFALQQQNRRHLRQRLEHQHAGHERQAREVPLEEFFVDGDVLDRDQPLAGVVLGNRVHEQRRKPVAEPVEDDGDVDGGHWGRMRAEGLGIRD